VDTTKSRIFPYLVGLAALLVAGSAAFYSVFGLSKLFSGATLAVIIMAGSLEFAKLVSASFLYRYWTKVNTWLKYYMVVGVVTLVMITSAGIFGFLSNAYQGATIEYEKQTATLFYKEDRLIQLEEDKGYLKEELAQSIAALPDNYPTAKRKLREEYNPKVLEINTQMLDIKQEIGDLKVLMIETGVDVGPAIYLARIFETDIDSVVKFFIFILIFVFDPMAVALVISYNIAMVNRKNKLPEPVESGIKKRVKHFLDNKVLKNKGLTKDKKVKKKVNKKIKDPEPELIEKSSVTQYGEAIENKDSKGKDYRIPIHTKLNPKIN
jgi:hypothetical protein